MKLLKILLKVFIWTFSSLVILLLLIIVLLNLPPVQNYLIDRVTHIVSDRTHSTVRIGKIGISFPKSVYLESVFLDDRQKDTLLYAGRIEANMDMLALISGDIAIDEVTLDDISANISRTATDSLFNFSFIVDAFAKDKADTLVREEKDSSASTFSISGISLNRIHFVFNDQYKGLLATTDFSKLDISFEQMDLRHLEFEIDDFIFSTAQIALTISGTDTSSQSESSGNLPTIKVKNLSLEKIAFKFLNVPDSTFISFLTDKLELKKSSAILATNNFSVDRITSDNTTFILKSEQTGKPSKDSAASGSINAFAGSVNLKRTTLFVDLNSQQEKNTFDPAHLHVRNLNLEVENTRYDKSGSTSKIKSFSAQLAEGFEVRELSANAVYSQKEFSLKGLQLQTKNTSLHGELSCSFSSLNAFRDSLAEVIVNANISRSVIDPHDITWFVPKLAEIPFLLPSSSKAQLDLQVSGPVKKLAVKKLVLTAGEKTSVTASAEITGLPDAQAAFFDVHHFMISTSKKDIQQNVPGKYLPEKIDLPEQLSITGNFKGLIRKFDADADLESTFGSCQLNIRMQPGERYNASANVSQFELGQLLQNEKTFGQVSFNLSVDGSGFTKENMQATARLDVSAAELNRYTYHDLFVRGKISDQQFDGSLNLNDPNIAADFKGLVGFKPGEEKYLFTLDLKGANLQKLNLSKDDLRIAAFADVDLTGNQVDNLNGRAGITRIIVVKANKTYALDSLLFASVNEKGKSEMSLKSAVLGFRSNGSISPGKLPSEIMNHIQHYFPVSDSLSPSSPQNNFTFEISLQNHPVISEVFLPKLKEFETGVIKGNFDGAKNILDIQASLGLLDYDGTVIRDASLNIKSDSAKFNLEVKAAEINSGSQMLEELSLLAQLKDNVAAVDLAVGKDEKERKLAIHTEITSPSKGNYQMQFGNEVTLGGSLWTSSPENKIRFGNHQRPEIRFALENKEEQISIQTADTSSLETSFRNFQLIHLSDIFRKDTALAEGTLNGNFNLYHDGSFKSQATLQSLVIRMHPVGDVEVSAERTPASQVNVSARLTGNDNDLSVTGTVSPKQKDNSLDLNLNIKSLSMTSVEGFSFGALQHSAGKLTGDFTCRGTFAKPLIDGKLHFNDVTTTPVALNNPLTLKNETIVFSKDEISFTSFTLRDKKERAAIINGNIQLPEIDKPVFNLSLTTDQFLAMNSTQAGGFPYFGTVVLDSKIKITGTPSFPKINADLRLDAGSYLGVAVPESRLTADRGEGIVEFSTAKLHPILREHAKVTEQKTEFKNIEVNADIRIDKDAALKILIDPASGDSLVVKGEAALSFALDPSGKISLTGRYELQDGSYLVTLQDLIRKQFKIEKGSSITWNGDPMDADVDMRAIYRVRTSPIDLVASQVSGLTDAERNKYKQRLEFEVVLKLKGPLLTPDISFEIQMPAESRGALGGAVNAKLMQLNEDESELNKQVFALLVLNRFIQEDPLASESGSGAEGIARQSVGRFLSQQLNQLSNRYISGVEFDFDVQSYDDYSTGQAEGRTQVDIGLKKQFNDRFSVQVGGSVDVEGERTKQNNLSDLTGDILIEYKLTEDGRYRLKGFRRNEYEGIIEGQLTETGAGVLYTRDFDRWKELFKKPDESTDQ